MWDLAGIGLWLLWLRDARDAAINLLMMGISWLVLFSCC